MNAVDRYKVSRRNRLLQRMKEASSQQEAMRLAVIIYKTYSDRFNADGGPGSGNWGHEGVKGNQGGSAPGGGIQNRQVAENGSFTSFSKIKAAAAKPHQVKAEEIKKITIGTEIITGEGDKYIAIKSKYGGIALHNANGGEDDIELDIDFTGQATADGLNDMGDTRIAIPKSDNPNYNVDHSVDYKALFDKGHVYTRNEYDDEYREQTGELWNNFNQKTKEALYGYTESGFVSINRVLRQDLSDPYTLDKIDVISGAIEKSSLQQDTILYRGIYKKDFEKLVESEPGSLTPENINRFVGVEGTDDGFMSTGSAKGTGYTSEVSLNIMAPKGTKALYCEPFSAYGFGGGMNWDSIKGDGKTEQKDYSNEFETLLQKGTSIHVISGKYDEVEDLYTFDAVITGQNGKK